MVTLCVSVHFHWNNRLNEKRNIPDDGWGFSLKSHKILWKNKTSFPLPKKTQNQDVQMAVPSVAICKMYHILHFLKNWNTTYVRILHIVQFYPIYIIIIRFTIFYCDYYLYHMSIKKSPSEKIKRYHFDKKKTVRLFISCNYILWLQLKVRN